MHTRRFADFEATEDAVQETLPVAVTQWPDEADLALGTLDRDVLDEPDLR
jgi:hypothetical protein